MKTNFKFYLTFLVLLQTTLYSEEDWTIICPGDARATYISALDYTFGVEDDPELLPMVMGEPDPVNSDFPYWDDTSPACGGDGEQNIIIYRGCEYGSNNSCFDVELGDLSGYNVIDFDSTTEEYYNTVTFVNGLPCAPHDTDKIGVGVYNWNNNANFGIASVKTPHERGIYAYDLTLDQQKLHRGICGGGDGDGGDYTEQLNKLIENTDPNSVTSEKLTSIDNRQKSLDTELETFISGRTIDDILDSTTDTEEFSDTFESTLNESFETYSDIFGIGGYGSAPAPITFSCCGRSYTLFDVSSLSGGAIDTIRAAFLFFGYFWGFILVFRSI